MNAPVFEVLRAPTPQAWLDAAVVRQHELLLDHASCEKKAASTALSLMFAYADDADLSRQLARLAREELRHYEQVQRLMDSLDVPYRRLQPGRYADRLRREVHTTEPGRRVDLLIAGALIEARSCERFIALAPLLPGPVGELYRALSDSEARHHELYLELARRSSTRFEVGDVQLRLAQFARVEAQLINAPDEQFRFHSGPPPSRAPGARD